MFWRSKKDAPQDATPLAAKAEQPLPDWPELRRQDLAVVFKHSPSCATSWAAQSQVKKFIALNPEIPVYTILVRQDREVSRQIAEITRIRHESPQVIILRHGAPVANASHQDVTVDFLTDAITESAQSSRAATKPSA